MTREESVALRRAGASLRKLAAMSKKKQYRTCLCCGARFLSDVPHHRLCSRCRCKSLSPFDVPHVG